MAAGQHTLTHNTNAPVTLGPAGWVRKNGWQIEIRPMQPEYEARMIKFHQGLSERSVYMRYFESPSFAKRTAHDRLAKVCFSDPSREIVLVAIYGDQHSSERDIVAVGRLTRQLDTNKAELALLVSDKFQGRGLGTELVRQLIRAAQEHRFTQIEAEILRDNFAMQKVLRKFGFHFRLLDPRCVRATLIL